MSDARLDELINAELDDTLDENGHRELQRLLQASPDAGQAQRAYRQLDELLRNLPEEPLPQSLRERIAASVRLPASTAANDRSGSNKPWASPATRVGFAIAAGVLLSIGIFNVIGPDVGDASRGDMVGSMVPQGNGVIDRVRLAGTDFSAGASLRRGDAGLLLDVDLYAVQPVEIAVDFSSTGLQFETLTAGSEVIDSELKASVLRINSGGQRKIQVYFSREDGATAEGAAAIQLEVSSDGQESRQGTLRLGQ